MSPANSRRTERKAERDPRPARLEVKKTYKLYIGGKFPRSESGRSYEVTDGKGRFLANAAWASRKDARDAVVAARKAYPGWSGATVRRTATPSATRSATGSGATSSGCRRSKPMSRDRTAGSRARSKSCASAERRHDPRRTT